MIKYIKIVLVLLVVLNSCHTVPDEPIIGLEDLDFADVEREYIVANKICTMFVSADYHHRIRSVSSMRSPLDTLAYFYTYDTNGRLLTETGVGLWSHTLRLEYDSIGLVKYRRYFTDFLAEFIPTYEYIQEKRMLYQYWRYWDLGIAIDTCFFIFDKKGRIIESEEYEHKDCGQGNHFKTTYTYNSDGKLQNKTETILINKDDLLYLIEWIKKDWTDAEYWLKRNSLIKSTEYYYTNGKIDSTITANFLFKIEWNYTSKTYYDHNGLRVRTVNIYNSPILCYYLYDQSVPIKEFEKDTLIYYYSYKKYE